MGARDQATQAWTEALKLSPNMPLTNYVLAGAAAAQNSADSAAKYEQKADSVTPNNAHFHWMLGLRLQNLKFSEFAEKRFAQAVGLDPSLASRR